MIRFRQVGLRQLANTADQAAIILQAHAIVGDKSQEIAAFKDRQCICSWYARIF